MDVNLAHEIDYEEYMLKVGRAYAFDIFWSNEPYSEEREDNWEIQIESA